ncbi:MAG TPA: O-antigen ligase family protein [Candidatus Dormibacteraeota bacterium]|nr:O-antigen ligase family protein [Candidatus Dormibacteraeota bacterium]
MRWSRIGVFLTAAALPAYVLRGHLLGRLPFTGLEVVLGLTVLAFIVESAEQRRMPRLDTPFSVIMVVLLLGTAIGVLASPHHQAALGIAKSYIVEPMVLFFVAVNVLRSSWDWERVVYGLYVGGLVVALSQMVAVAGALVNHTLNLNVAPPIPSWLWTNNNFGGIFLDPLVGLALGLALFGGVRHRNLHWAAVVVLGLGDVLTLSRGSWLALVVLALLAAGLHPRRRLLLAVCLVALVGAVVLPPVRHRISNELNPSSPANSLIARTRLWHATVDLIEAHPFTGSGLAGFQSQVAPYREQVHDPASQTHVYPDQLELDFWVELGVLGFVALLGFLAELVRYLVPMVRAGPRDHPWAVALGLAWVAIVLHGLLDSPYWKNDLSAEWWILAALVTVAVVPASKHLQFPRRKPVSP